MTASQTADVGFRKRSGTTGGARNHLTRAMCRLILSAALLLAAAGMVSMGGAASVASAHGWQGSSQPDFGPNVYVFTPSMPQSEIQSQVNAIANQQVSNQFGDQRYALLFMPGTYGSQADPLTFQVGYYTEVAGLGARRLTWSSTAPLTFTTSVSARTTASPSTISGARYRTSP